jgi:hypothetical protein
MSRLRLDLRDGVGQKRLHPFTLQRLMDTHRRHPSQYLRLFGWRTGPVGKLTIYDQDMPRRQGVIHLGHADEEWFAQSVVANVSDDSMGRHPEIIRPDGSGGHAVNVTKPRDNDIVRPSYIQVIGALLRNGCVVPGRAWDDWLNGGPHDPARPSLEWCDPDLRLFYKDI